MLREPPTTFYSISNIERKPLKHQGSNFSRNNAEYDEAIKTYPITTPVNKALDDLLKNGQLGENVHKIIRIIQKKYLPQINKLEILLLKNPTYLYIAKIIGISKENAVRATGVIASIAIIYTVNSIIRRHKSLLLDVFTYVTPALSIAEILKNEPDLIDEKKNKNKRLVKTTESFRSEYVKCHQLKTWLIYLIISSLFNITDNFFINKDKPVIEPSITQTVITTTPYLLRDTNKQIYTTIAQVTPFSQRFYNSFTQRMKNTFKYSWYWVMKFCFIYWMGYKDGRELIYNKFVIPCIRKYCEFEFKSKRAFSEMDITFEDGDSFSKKYKYIPTNHRPRVAGNTRDQGLQPALGSKDKIISNFNSNESLNTESSFCRFDENGKKEDFNTSRNLDGYYSDSFYESSEPINSRLNNTSNILNSIKYNSNTNKMVQNTDSLSVEDPWKNTSLIGNPIKRNRSFSLNNINHANNSLNNYRATIFDVNNKLSDYYNDIGIEKDNNESSQYFNSKPKK